MTVRISVLTFCIPAAILLSGCKGLMDDLYDEADTGTVETVAGELYIDASDWTQWHYLDLKALPANVSDDPGYNPSSAWVTMPIPTEPTDGPTNPGIGIYTYWYDVFGQGIGKCEYRDFYPTAPQPEPESWTLAVHRNNVRTNGCSAAATDLMSFDELPDSRAYYTSLDFHPDVWDEKDVWVIQDRMLLGLIGNQGIDINSTLSSWLTIDIPPMPPAFTLDSRVYILRLDDGSLAALQLENYQSTTGAKCCLTIKYRYPL